MIFGSVEYEWRDFPSRNNAILTAGNKEKPSQEREEAKEKKKRSGRRDGKAIKERNRNVGREGGGGGGVPFFVPRMTVSADIYMF